MSDSIPPDSASHGPTRKAKTPSSWRFTAFVIPVAVAAIFYTLEPFQPIHYPTDELSRKTLTAPALNMHMLRGSELVAEGQLAGPEDLVYDAGSRVIYTGCQDGWIKRVTVNESAADMVVEKWVNTRGRPLGLALGHDGEIIVADAYKGLLTVTKERKVELLTDEAEGLKFKLTDGVDIARDDDDGTIYFTDASYKYSLKDVVFDILEGKPHGRLLSYKPATNNTTVLARSLYFPNGVVISPDQSCVVFCETVLRRCRKYYIKGHNTGIVEKFIDDLPGMPDNIHYDGEGHYWIALTKSLTPSWDLALTYPFVRKIIGMMTKYVGRPKLEKNGGVLAVDLNGKLKAHYYDSELSLISSGIKIGNHIYCGSVLYSTIIRLDVKKNPAIPIA